MADFSRLWGLDEMKRFRTGVTELDLLRDLMLGGRHSPSTAIDLGVLDPASRQLARETSPGMKWRRPPPRRPRAP